MGLTEQQARMQGRGIRVARISMRFVPRAIEVGESRGVVVLDAGTHEILGAAVVGIEGGEIMAMLKITMIGRLPYTALRDAVFAYPTLAELLNTLFATLDDEALAKTDKLKEGLIQ